MRHFGNFSRLSAPFHTRRPDASQTTVGAPSQSQPQADSIETAPPSYGAAVNPSLTLGGPRPRVPLCNDEPPHMEQFSVMIRDLQSELAAASRRWSREGWSYVSFVNEGTMVKVNFERRLAATICRNPQRFETRTLLSINTQDEFLKVCDNMAKEGWSYSSFDTGETRAVKITFQRALPSFMRGNVPDYEDTTVIIPNTLDGFVATSREMSAEGWSYESYANEGNMLKVTFRRPIFVEPLPEFEAAPTRPPYMSVGTQTDAADLMTE